MGQINGPDNIHTKALKDLSFQKILKIVMAVEIKTKLVSQFTNIRKMITSWRQELSQTSSVT